MLLVCQFARDAGDVVVTEERERDELIEELVVPANVQSSSCKLWSLSRTPDRLPQLMLGSRSPAALARRTRCSRRGSSRRRCTRPEKTFADRGGTCAQNSAGSHRSRPGANRRPPLQPVAHHLGHEVHHLRTAVVEGHQIAVPLEVLASGSRSSPFRRGGTIRQPVSPPLAQRLLEHRELSADMVGTRRPAAPGSHAHGRLRPGAQVLGIPMRGLSGSSRSCRSRATTSRLESGPAPGQRRRARSGSQPVLRLGRRCDLGIRSGGCVEESQRVHLPPDDVLDPGGVHCTHSKLTCGPLRRHLRVRSTQPSRPA